jgi:hypothetical protein
MEFDIPQTCKTTNYKEFLRNNIILLYHQSSQIYDAAVYGAANVDKAAEAYYENIAHTFVHLLLIKSYNNGLQKININLLLSWIKNISFGSSSFTFLIRHSLREIPTDESVFDYIIKIIRDCFPWENLLKINTFICAECISVEKAALNLVL